MRSDDRKTKEASTLPIWRTFIQCHFIAESIFDRLNEVRVVFGEVVQRHDAAFALYELDDCLRNPALIVTRLSVLRESPERLRKVRHLHDLPYAWCLAVNQHLFSIWGGVLDRGLAAVPL